MVYGCALPGGRSFRLGTLGIFGHMRLDHAAVAGRVVAYGVTTLGVDTATTAVMVRRLTNGAELGSFSATNDLFPESFQSIGSLVINSDGRVAWIAKQTSIAAHAQAIAVFQASSPAARATLLDSGVAIDPTSLRLSGSALSWRHGGTARHATLS